MRTAKNTKRFLVIIGLAFVCLVRRNMSGADAFEDPDKDPRLADSLKEAERLILKKQVAPAIGLCDKVIAAYDTKYGRSKEKIYCARGGPETLGTLLSAASKNENAIALSMTWANAWFIKGYALQEVGRLAEAKSAVEAAVKLAPWQAHFSSELGQIYSQEGNWAKAKEQFELAEDHAELASTEAKANELARARRGLGYVYVELGKLDEARRNISSVSTQILKIRVPRKSWSMSAG